MRNHAIRGTRSSEVHRAGAQRASQHARRAARGRTLQRSRAACVVRQELGLQAEALLLPAQLSRVPSGPCRGPASPSSTRLHQLRFQRRARRGLARHTRCFKHHPECKQVLSIVLL